MNNTITEVKNTLEGIESRKTEAEEQISELEHRVVEITATEHNKSTETSKVLIIIVDAQPVLILSFAPLHTSLVSLTLYYINSANIGCASVMGFTLWKVVGRIQR